MESQIYHSVLVATKLATNLTEWEFSSVVDEDQMSGSTNNTFDLTKNSNHLI